MARTKVMWKDDFSQVWIYLWTLFSKAFKVHLSSLQRKLARPADWIECQRSLGYRLGRKAMKLSLRVKITALCTAILDGGLRLAYGIL